MGIETRKPIFDAIKAARGKAFTQMEVGAIDNLLDALGVARDSNEPKRVSSEGLAIIKRSEGLRLKTYLDTGGVPTIGWGHTGPDVKTGMTITEARADALLAADVAWAEEAVRQQFPITTQPQFDALVSFMFNLGPSQVRTSTLRRKHNEGDYAGAVKEFARWRFDNGKELAGLVRRRAEEAELYRRVA
jgi:lysozyme